MKSSFYKSLLIFFLVISFLAAGVFFLSGKHDQGKVLSLTRVVTVTPAYSYPDSAIYPLSRFTPGDIFSGVTEKEVCVTGYSSKVRSVPLSVKKEVFAEYGLNFPPPRGEYEVDHFISLELGGSNDSKNLWPESAMPVPGFREKNRVENYLHKEVCDGKLSLKAAQEEIRNDWYRVYLQMKGQ